MSSTEMEEKQGPEKPQKSAGMFDRQTGKTCALVSVQGSVNHSMLSQFVVTI